MNLNELLSGLTEKQKRKLAEAKTPGELDALAEPDVVQLSDGALDAVSGGGCFTPCNCSCGCGWTGIAPNGSACPQCGNRVHLKKNDTSTFTIVQCQICGTPASVSSAGGMCPFCGQFIQASADNQPSSNGRII